MRNTVLVTAFAALLACSLAGCGGASGTAGGTADDAQPSAETEQQPAEKTDAELLVGTWTERDTEHQEWMTFTEDGTATMDDSGHSIEVAYKVDEAMHTITLSNDSNALVMEYSFVDDDTIEITSDGETSTLVRDTSETAIPASVDVQPEYLDIDGGLTINALQGLTGPEVVALLTQQGYVCDGTMWKNETTGGKLSVRNLHGDLVAERGYAAAAGVGELAEGYTRIVTDARSITTTGDLETIRDAMVQGFTVEDSWTVGFGAYLYSVVVDPAGERYIIIVVAENENEATVEFETDAYLATTDEGSVDGVIELWRS